MHSIVYKRYGMSTITLAEKRALEEVFICLEVKKRRRLECLKKYLLFY